MMEVAGLDLGKECIVMMENPSQTFKINRIVIIYIIGHFKVE